MMMASNRIAGALTATPDVCLTPPVPVPVPYFNTAFTATAIAFVPNVLITGGNALNLGTILAMSTGDEPGVAHWTVKGFAAFLAGCPTVFFGGLPAIGLTHPGFSNKGNAAKGAVTIPSATTVFLAHGASAQTMLTAEEALSIARALGPEEDTVSGHMGDDRVGHLVIHRFSSSVLARAHGWIQRLLRAGARELVIDLRDNPGGVASAAIDLASDLLEQGALVITAIDEDGDERDHRARGDVTRGLPITLWVNRQTASAAEIFAGSLAAHGRATLFGERTAGKGIGQKLAPSADGRAVVPAEQMRYRLPDGRKLGALGG